MVLGFLLCAFWLSLMLVNSKTIELSGMELQKLRLNLQKLQQQNLQLAQANSQMLAVPSHLLIASCTILLNHAVPITSVSNGISSSRNILETVFDALVKLTCFASLQELNSGKDRVS